MLSRFLDNLLRGLDVMVRLEPYWVMALAIPLTFPAQFVSLRWHPILVCALFVWWPLHWLRERLYNRRAFPGSLTPTHITHPLRWPVLLLTLCIPISLWIAIQPERAWIAAGHLTLGIALFVAFVRWPLLLRRPTLLLFGLLTVGLVLLVVGPFFLVGSNRMRLLPGIFEQASTVIATRLGQTINSNVLAGNLVLLAPIALAHAFQSYAPIRTWPWPIIARRLAWLLVGVSLLSMALLLQSRGALVAGFVAALVVVALRWRLMMILLPIAAATLIGVLAWAGPGWLFAAPATDQTVIGLPERMEIWVRAFYILQDFSFTGSGIGMFSEVTSLLYPYFLITPQPHAHNLFLQVGVDLGIPGLLAFFAIHVGLVYMTIRVLKTVRTDMDIQSNSAQLLLSGEQQWGIMAGCLGALTAMWLHGLVDAASWGTKLAFVPWMIYALMTIVFVVHDTHQRAR